MLPKLKYFGLLKKTPVHNIFSWLEILRIALNYQKLEVKEKNQVTLFHNKTLHEYEFMII